MIRRVLEGGEGLTRAGTSQRSMKVGFSAWVVVFNFEDDVGESGGVDAWGDMRDRVMYRLIFAYAFRLAE